MADWVDDLESELFPHDAPPNPPDEDPRWATPGSLAQALNPKTVQTPALQAIDEALIETFNTANGRLIITMSPQEGKSSRVSKDFILWVLKHHPQSRIVMASYGQTLASRNGRFVRNAITSHPELGLHIAHDNGSVAEWQLHQQEGGVFSVGIGGGVTGRSADLMIIDDPIKDRTTADSELYRDNAWDWWTDVASTRLSPGAPVIMILTRWHEDDLAGRMIAAPDGHLWRVLRLPVIADHDPDENETDPLGRAPGEYLVSARGRTPEDWEAIRTRVGTRTWDAMYQGRPNSAGGTIFKDQWWSDHQYETPFWLTRDDGSKILTGFDDLMISWDMTFKDKETSDYVVGTVWARKGVDVYLLPDRVHAQLDFPATCRAVKTLNALWPQVILNVVEDKANGPAVIASLRRQVLGLVPEEPQGSKVARASAGAPLVEAGNVHVPSPELAPWITEFIDEHSKFPNGKHDDYVDSTSQALNRLLLQPLLMGLDLGNGSGIVHAEDFDVDMRDFGSYIP